MKLWLNYLLVVSLLLLDAFVNGDVCFPGEKADSNFPRKKVRMGHLHYEESEAIAHYAAHLLREKLNVDVELVKLYFDFEGKYINEVETNNVDFIIGAYETYADLSAFSKVASVGLLGYTEKGSWYIPKYLAENVPASSTYLGFKQVFEETNLFCSGSVGHEHQSFKSVMETTLATHADCADANSKECFGEINSYYKQNVNTNCKLDYLTYPNNGEWLLDGEIMNNLAIANYIDWKSLIEIGDPGALNVSLSRAIYDFARERYDKEDPFMIFIYDPGFILSPLTGMEFIEVYLPPHTPECEKHYFTETSDQFACSYSSDRLITIANTEFETSHPAIFRFIRDFRLTNDDIKDMLYMQEFGVTSDLEKIACTYLNQPEIRANWESNMPIPDETFQKEISSVILIVFSVIAGLLLLIAVLHTGMVVIYHKNENVKTGSSLFLFFISVFSSVAFLNIVLYILDVSPAMCMIRTALEIVSFFGILVALIFKTARVAVLFKMSRPSKNQRTAVNRLTDNHMMIYYGVIMLAVVIFLIIYLVVAPPEPKTKIISTEKLSGGNLRFTYELFCESNTEIFQIVFLICQLGLSLLGCYLAFAVRNTPSAFSSAKLMGAAMYNLFMCLIVQSIILYLTSADVQVRYVTWSAFTLFATAVTLFLVVSSKFYCIFRGWVPDFSHIYKTSSKDGSKSKSNFTTGGRNRAQSTSRSRRPSYQAKSEKMNSITLDIVREDGTKEIMIIGESVNEQQEKSTDNLAVNGGVYDG